MKKIVLFSICTFISCSLYGKACLRGTEISVKNTTRDPINVYVVHPDFCGSPDIDSLRSSLKRTQWLRDGAEQQINEEEAKMFSADIIKLEGHRRTYEDYTFEIAKLEKQIKEAQEKHEKALKAGESVAPGNVCKSFTVEPGKIGSEKEFTQAFFARSYEVHVWDDHLKTTRYATYVKPGCTLEYPADFSEKKITQYPGKDL